MDFQKILKEKYLNDIINNNINFLNHIETKSKMLHQIKFSKSLKLIDPYYKLKKDIDINNYHNHSILYRYLIKDRLNDHNITYKNIMTINLTSIRRNIDRNIFRLIEFNLWNNKFNYMILSFIHKRSVSDQFTQRCYFNLRYIDLEIERKRNELILKKI
jgi:hypothetical protein